MNGGFIKGMGMGLVAGVLVTAMALPMDKKRVMRSGAGKTIKAIGRVAEGLSSAFM